MNDLQNGLSQYDMRDELNPRRLTLAMWDYAYLYRHIDGESFANYDKVLDEAKLLGYNTLRLDPLPHMIDLDEPDKVFSWAGGKKYMPWCIGKGGSSALGRNFIECVQKLKERGLYYTLSTWWNTEAEPKPSVMPRTNMEAAEVWAEFLYKLGKHEGFENLVYVDIHNEVPYFLPGYLELLQKETGESWADNGTVERAEGGGPISTGKSFTRGIKEFLINDINGAVSMLQREFPKLRFTASIHADERWLDVPVEFDCLDVHFFVDDKRWHSRTCFSDLINSDFYSNDSMFKEFSDRCTSAVESIGPMIHARQRNTLALFSRWAQQNGMPLTTSESWSSWFYIDHPDLDWTWLKKWSSWTVQDAIDYKMWGWTSFNYLQPQFENWKDVNWHRNMTERFINSR